MAVADYTGRTAWSRAIPTPLREFLRTETGSAVLLLAATVAALLWVNVDSHSYSSLWTTRVSIEVGDSGIALDLRGWINSGLMTFFFFVIGLEARREFDLGELRDRRRLALPMVAALGGAFGAVAIYLAINAGRPSAHGWGVAMSTDTAFALGLLALVGPRFPDRLRAFLLTVAVVDDVVALVVIVLFYSSSIDVTPLVIAVAFYAAALVLHRARVRVGLAYFLLGVGAWVGLFEAGDRADRRRARARGAPVRVLRLAARRSSWRPSAFASFGNSRPPASPGPQSPSSAQRRRRMSGCSSSTTRGRATSSCRCSRSRTPASWSTATCWGGPCAPRSRWASCSATSFGKPVGIAGGVLARHAPSAAGGCGRRSAGPRCSAAAPSPASGSPSRC